MLSSLSVSITNTLVEISSKLDANWNEIVPTLQLDRRIGKSAYLKPGLGISGGNIERDLATIKEIGKSKNTNVNLIKTIISLSKYNKDWLFKKWNILKIIKIKDMRIRFSL